MEFVAFAVRWFEDPQRKVVQSLSYVIQTTGSEEEWSVIVLDCVQSGNGNCWHIFYFLYTISTQFTAIIFALGRQF